MLPLQTSIDLGLGSDGNEEELRIHQTSSITGTSPSDCLESYPKHSLWESYLAAEKQSVYFTAPADWATRVVAPKSVLSMGQIELNSVLMLNWIAVWHLNPVQTNDSC